jgi:hypothetical protein
VSGLLVYRVQDCSLLLIVQLLSAYVHLVQPLPVVCVPPEILAFCHVSVLLRVYVHAGQAHTALHALHALLHKWQ